MEDKVKRESRQYVEKLFKKFDTIGAGAITKADMHKLIVILVDSKPYDEAELEELIDAHCKESKYTVHNKKTNQFEVKYRQDTLDFPSVLAIAVKVLLKTEKPNQFSGSNLIQLRHFPKPKIAERADVQMKRKIF